MMNGLPQPFGAGHHRSVLPSERQELPPRAEAVVERCQGRPKPVRWFVLLAVLFGLVCRLSQYAANTSLWHDEAYVALSILHKSFVGLLGPLDWKEASPPGFLLLEKLAVALRWAGRSMRSALFHSWPGSQGSSVLPAWPAGSAARGSPRSLRCYDGGLSQIDRSIQRGQAFHDGPVVARCYWGGWPSGSGICEAPGARSWHGARWGRSGSGSPSQAYSCLPERASCWRLVLSATGLAGATAYVAANLAVLVSLVLLLGPIRAQLSGDMLGFWAKSFPDTSGFAALVYWLGRSHLGLFDYFWRPFGGVLVALALVGGVRCWRTGRRAELLCLWLPVLDGAGCVLSAPLALRRQSTDGLCGPGGALAGGRGDRIPPLPPDPLAHARRLDRCGLPAAARSRRCRLPDRHAPSAPRGSSGDRVRPEASASG